MFHITAGVGVSIYGHCGGLVAKSWSTLAIPWTVACQAPLSMGFSRQEYWNRLPFPYPGDLSDPGIESMSLTSPALAGGFFTTNTTWEALHKEERFVKHK